MDYVAPHDPTASASLWRLAWADVNSDGLLDALAYSVDPEWCGSGGCTLLVIEAMPEFDQEEMGPYMIAAEIERVSEPVRVASQRTSGWCDLVVRSEGGHGVRLQFDGETYPFSPADGVRTEGTGSDSGAILFSVAE